ncbi:MAG: nucleotidyltransferase family protein [Patescibacteria group bacterium]
MKGIILAGGKGTRIYPLTLTIPKPLIEVRGKPLLNYSVQMFVNHGVDDIKIIIRPRDREAYEKWLKSYSSSFTLAKFSFEEEPEPMGTLGYIAHYLRDWIGEDDVFITNSDDIKNVDITAMAAFHKKTGAHATMALGRVDKPEEYGAVTLNGDMVAEFLEKQENPPSNLVSIGVYLLSPPASEYMETFRNGNTKFLMIEKDLWPVIAQSGKLAGFIYEGKFFDCGTPERLERAIREL